MEVTDPTEQTNANYRSSGEIGGHAVADRPAWKSSTLVAAAVVAAFVIGVIAGNSMNSSSRSTESTASSYSSGTRASSTTTSAPDPAVTGQYTAGVYTVGEDIQPGTYSTPGADRCYWKRSRNASGGSGSIIANDVVNGRGVMTIEAGDRYVTFDGDCVWTKK